MDAMGCLVQMHKPYPTPTPIFLHHHIKYPIHKEMQADAKRRAGNWLLTSTPKCICKNTKLKNVSIRLMNFVFRTYFLSFFRCSLSYSFFFSLYFRCSSTNWLIFISSVLIETGKSFGGCKHDTSLSSSTNHKWNPWKVKIATFWLECSTQPRITVFYHMKYKFMMSINNQRNTDTFLFDTECHSSILFADG